MQDGREEVWVGGFNLARHGVVHALVHFGPEAVALGGAEVVDVRHLPRLEVGEPQRAEAPRAVQRVELGERLLNGRRAVGCVQVQQVQALALQRRAALVDLGPQLGAREAPCSRQARLSAPDGPRAAPRVPGRLEEGSAHRCRSCRHPATGPLWSRAHRTCWRARTPAA